MRVLIVRKVLSLPKENVTYASIFHIIILALLN